MIDPPIGKEGKTSHTSQLLICSSSGVWPNTYCQFLDQAQFFCLWDCSLKFLALPSGLLILLSHPCFCIKISLSLSFLFAVELPYRSLGDPKPSFIQFVTFSIQVDSFSKPVCGLLIKSVYKLSSLVSESEVAQSCPTLCDPMDCSLPGSSVHGIFQAIVLEWIAISFSRGSSQTRD